MTLQSYLDDVKPISITKMRRFTNDTTVIGAEKTKLMSLVGQLAWVAREFLSQIAFDVSDLQQRFKVATVTELVRANTVLRQAKKLVLTNVFELVSIIVDQATFISVTDASLVGQQKSSSQMGLAVLMSTGKILEGSDTANMIE